MITNISVWVNSEIDTLFADHDHATMTFQFGSLHYKPESIQDIDNVEEK